MFISCEGLNHDQTTKNQPNKDNRTNGMLPLPPSLPSYTQMTDESNLLSHYSFGRPIGSYPSAAESPDRPTPPRLEGN